MPPPHQHEVCNPQMGLDISMAQKAKFKMCFSAVAQSNINRWNLGHPMIILCFGPGLLVSAFGTGGCEEQATVCLGGARACYSKGYSGLHG